MDLILKGLQGLADSTFGKMLNSLITSLYSWVSGVMDFIASWWLGIKPLGIDEGTASFRMAETISPFVAWVGIPALMIALVRAAKNNGSYEDTTQIVNGLFRTVIFGAVGMMGTHLLMQSSSAIAPWIFDTITSDVDDVSRNLSSMMSLDGTEWTIEGPLAGLMIVVLPFMLIASVIQAMMALGTETVANVLGATLAVTAAASTTKAGEAALRKQISWILACVAFKPVAAVLYGFGVALVHGSNFLSSVRDEDSASPMLGMLMGAMTLIMVCFSLPALVKLLVPMSSVIGSSGGRFIAAAAGVAGGAAFQAFSSSGGSSGSSSSSGSGGGSSSAGASGADINSAGGASGSSKAGTASSSAGAGAGEASAGAASAGAGAATGGATVAAEAAAGAAQKTGEAVKDAASATSGEAASSAGAGSSDAASGASGGEDPTAPLPMMDSASDASSSASSGAEDASSEASPASTGAPDAGSGADSSVDASADGAGETPSTGSGSSGSAAAGSGDASSQSSGEISYGISEDGSSSAPGAPTQSSQTGADSSSSTNSAPTVRNSSYNSGSGPSGAMAQRYLSELARSAGEEQTNAIQAEGADI